MNWDADSGRETETLSAAKFGCGRADELIQSSAKTDSAASTILPFA
jgi:hypothetical protein